MTTQETVQRYPLAWPIGWKRTNFNQRRHGKFSETVATRNSADNSIVKRGKTVSMATAVERLESQLDKLGAADPTLSTNVKLNMRGIPYGNEQANDPGVAVYFRFKGRATVLACDRYCTVADNVAALAAHIDALRRIERYGVGSLEQALAGYKSLPADSAADWRSVFGFNAADRVTAEQVQSAFKMRAATAHPDKGGTDEAMMHVNRAREYALAEVLA